MHQAQEELVQVWSIWRTQSTDFFTNISSNITNNIYSVILL